MFRRRRSYGRRYSGRKRKRYFRPGYDRTGGLYRKRRRLQRFGMEKKFYEGSLSITSIGTGGVHPVNISTSPTAVASTIVGIPEGTSQVTRIGSKCTITDIFMRLNFSFLTASSANLDQNTFAHETVRVIVYWDKQANSLAIANPLVLLATDLYNAFRNLSNKHRFRILFDKLITFNTTAGSAGNGTTQASQRVVRDYQVKLAKKVFIPIEYSADTGDIDTIRSNNIGVMVWSKHGTRMSLSGSPIRMRFIDF